jgi:hypothetical protein
VSSIPFATSFAILPSSFLHFISICPHLLGFTDDVLLISINSSPLREYWRTVLKNLKEKSQFQIMKAPDLENPDKTSTIS